MVIIVEGTGGIELLLPVILAIVLSNWVAHHIHTEGAYESDLERIGEVHFLQSEPSQNLHFIAARDIMAPDVICFREITPLAEVVRVLRETSHNGFPIIQQTHGDALDLDGQLVGVMLRHQILLLLEQRAIFEIDSALVGRQVRHGLGFRLPVLTKEQKYLDRLMRVFHHSHHPHRRYLSSRPEAVNETEIVELLPESTLPTVNGGSGTDSVEVHHKYDSVKQSKDSGKEFAVDFRPWMNRAPLTVRAETSARRVYIIFRTLGLRHLCVTDASNRVVGMITRIDLSKADKAVEVDPITPRETDHDNSQSFGVKFPGHQLSPNDRTARDVLFSLP